MLNTTTLKLKNSEAAVLAAASRIYSAHIANSLITPENSGAIMDQRIETAIVRAKRTDRLIKSDGEMG